MLGDCGSVDMSIEEAAIKVADAYKSRAEYLMYQSNKWCNFESEDYRYYKNDNLEEHNETD